MRYDIIGDVHGHSAKLEALLRLMGYRHHAGAWRHPDASAIFVGDFVDRGPGQLETIRIVREMLDAGTAQAVMGNHEFNAIAWHTADPGRDGEFLRRRSPKNREQHAAFLAEVEGKAEHAELITWFMTLPLWLELPGLRVVHACWHPAHMAKIGPYLRSGRTLSPELVVQASLRGTMEHAAIETLLKGLEIELPAGHSFRDKEGNERHEVRTRWWDINANTYRTAAILGRAEREALPDIPIPTSALLGYESDIPVFFGHYWWSGTPAPLAPHVACVDYSAGKGGPLVAYRWNGESVLVPRHFTSIA